MAMLYCAPVVIWTDRLPTVTIDFGTDGLVFYVIGRPFRGNRQWLVGGAVPVLTALYTEMSDATDRTRGSFGRVNCVCAL